MIYSVFIYIHLICSRFLGDGRESSISQWENMWQDIVSSAGRRRGLTSLGTSKHTLTQKLNETNCWLNVPTTRQVGSEHVTSTTCLSA